MNQPLHKDEAFISLAKSDMSVGEIARAIGRPESTVRDNRRRVLGFNVGGRGVMDTLPVGDVEYNPFKLPSLAERYVANNPEPVKAKEGPVFPAYIPEPKFERFVLVTDTHGDMIDKSVEKVFFDFVECWKPSIRAHLGDFIDLRPLRAGASPEEKQEDMSNDFSAGADFLTRFFEPNIGNTNLLTMGNHDERLWDWTKRICSVSRSWANERVGEMEGFLDGLDVDWCRYNKFKIKSIGKLNLVHGFSPGLSACRVTAASYGNVAFGHTHAIETCTMPNLEASVGYNIGALCQLDMGYNARTQSALRHSHGFAHGVVNKQTGDFHLWQDRQINGVWILPSDTVELS